MMVREQSISSFEWNLGLGVFLDDVRRPFSDSDDYCGGVSTDLVREDGRVDDAEALDAEYS
jgi:hypothetical protein